jgi:hypothetical protein
MFRGRPLPVCKTFLIYEAGILGRINSPKAYSIDQREKAAGTLDVGLMWNRSTSHAIGGIAHLSIDGGAVRIAALARYRRWFKLGGSGSSPLRIDVDAGPVVTTLDAGIYNQKWLNISSGVGLNLEDLLILTIRYETYRAGPRDYYDYTTPPYEVKTLPAQTNGTFYIGLKGGSYIGASASLVAAGIFAIALAAFANAD